MTLNETDKHLVMAEYYEKKMESVKDDVLKLFYKMRKDSHLMSIQRIKEKAE